MVGTLASSGSLSSPAGHQRCSPSLTLIVAAVLLGMLLLGTPVSAEQADATAGDAPLRTLRDETLAYFRPLAGRVVSVEDGSVKLEFDGKEEATVGMRLQAFNEGVSFVHPVTKEPLGRVEVPVGSVEVTSAAPGENRGVILNGKPADFEKAKVKIPGTRVRVLFYQGDVEWHLGDAYYQILKESGRFELIDTGFETDDTEKLLARAREKGAEVLLVLASENSAERISLTQRLLWVADGRQAAEKSVSVQTAYVKELRLKAAQFATGGAEALLSFNLPYSARRIAAGDVDGDGNQELVVVSGSALMVYQLGVDLKLLWEIKTSSLGDILWIETADLNNDHRDEILMTSFGSGSASGFNDEGPGGRPTGGSSVVTHVFSVVGQELVRTGGVSDMFVHMTSRGLVGQNYTRADGYDGNVLTMTYVGNTFKPGEPIKLPLGVNVYDFEYVASPDGRQGILAWDDNGYLNLYNDKGIRSWVSKEDYGGPLLTYKRESPTIMLDRGTWSVKDKLLMLHGEVLAPKRVPLAGVARGLGYKSSDLKGLWWNGMTVEERTFISSISGEILDYAPMGDKLVVLAKPLFGINAADLLKGKNPFVVSVFIYSAK